jgi:hypothetical protein
MVRIRASAPNSEFAICGKIPKRVTLALHFQFSKNSEAGDQCSPLSI